MDVYINPVTGLYQGTITRRRKDALENEAGFALVTVPDPVFRRLVCDPSIDYLYHDGTWSITELGTVMLLAENWRRVRTRRRNLLLATDFTQVTDAPFDAPTKAAWAVYRQALRDVTSQEDPTVLVWPVPPDPEVVSYVTPVEPPV